MDPDLLIGAGQETRDLWAWLRKASNLNNHIEQRRTSPPPQTMGAEIVVATVFAGVPVLARCICNYLAIRERNHRTEIELTITRKSGAIDHIKVNGKTDPEQLVRLLLGTDSKDDSRK